MDPKRAARLLASLGASLLLAILLIRGLSLVATKNIVDNTRLDIRGATHPVLGNYRVSADGRRVLFEQQSELSGTTAWFEMPTEGGAVSPVEPPPADLRPFLLREERLFVMVGDGTSLATGSPEGSKVALYARSPDGKTMAFAAYRETGDWGLYILTNLADLAWLGDEESVGDLAWSPDGESLAYTAPRKGVDQIFRIDRAGQHLEQLTFDKVRKSSPRWSPDRQWIVYLAVTEKDVLTAGKATPTPSWPVQDIETEARTDIYGMGADGSNPRRLTEDGLPKFDLNWAASPDGFEILYTNYLPEHPKTTYRYAVQPNTGALRRVYPLLTIEALRCPQTLPGGGEGSITVTLSNSGLRPAEVPLLMRSGPSPFPLTGSRTIGAVRAETVQVPAGGTQTIEAPVQAAQGLFTHISAMINIGDPFPMDEKHCMVDNTYLSLPHLPLLPGVAPVTIVGMLLCIPWLRHQKKAWLWMVWGAAAVAVMALVWIEAALVWAA